MARGRVAWTLLFAQLTGLALFVPLAAWGQVQINQQFVPQGPSPSQGPVSIVQSNDLPNGQGTVSGAVQAILLDPALGANTVFIGSPNGGVWSTNNFGAPNGGTIWTPLTDKQASLSIASLGLDVTDPSGKTLIAGVGITSNGGWSNGALPGPAGSGGLRTGLLYSTNAGATWSALGGAALAGQSVIGVAARGSTILAATFEEQAPTITQVGTSGPLYGLYRSVDSGQSFNRVTTGLPPGPVTALVADKTNPNTFYASVTSPTNPSAAGVYVSTNAGQSWNPVFTSATAVTGGTNVIAGATSQLVAKLATGPNGSVAIAIANVGTGQLSGLYLSQNSGTSWSGLTAPPVNAGSQQAIVNLAVAIDNNNTSKVYVTGDCCTANTTLPAYSVSPGQAPVSLTDNSSAHADSRALVLDANDNLLVGSDGGIYRLTSPSTNTGVWQGFNTSTLQIREPYAVAYGAYANRFVIAAQDTGGAVQSGANNVLYKAIQAADGVNATAADRTISNGAGGTVNASVYYTSIYNLTSLKRLVIDSDGNSTTADVKCNGQVCGCNPGNQTTCSAGFVFNNFFNSPFVINRADPSRVAMAGSNVYVAQDTAPANAATVDLTPTDLGFTGRYIQTIAFGTTDNPNVALAGSGNGGNGQLFLSTTASAGSMTAASALPAYQGFNPTSLVFDQRSSQRFYVADGANIWGTQNQGASINSLTSYLPTNISRPTSVEFINNNGVNALLVGGLTTVANAQSQIAVADSDNNGNLFKWRLFGSGLPNVLVSQMSYNPLADVLAIVGRGVWTLYDVTSYFPQATVLQFGLANNDSQPDASYLTDGNSFGSAFVRPLYKYGTGTLMIAGNATYTGGTTIFGGTLMLGNGGAGGSILGNVAFSACLGTTSPLCDPTINRTLAFNRSDAYAFGGAISGPGMVQQIGAGVTDLTAANTYTGPTFVNAGTLAVDGSITSQVFVNPGATLSGAGVVGSTAIAPGAALQPGAFSFIGGTPAALFGAPQPGYIGLGTLTVAGDLIFLPGSLYLPTTNSSTNVTGTATLAGTVVPLFLPGRVNKTTIILAAGNPLSTTFDGLLLPIQLSGSLGYTTNDVILNLTSQLANVPGLTPNEMAVGGGLDNAFNNNGGLPAFGSLYALSPTGLAVALNQLSGQSLASEQSVLTNQALYSRDAVLARLRQAGYATSSGPQAVLAYAGPDVVSMEDATDPGEPFAYAGSKKSATASAFPLKAPPAAVPYAPNTGITFWAQGMGGWGKINGNSNAAGTTGNFAGVLSGADVRLANNWLVGFALGYTGSSTSVSALASSAQVDTGLVAGYAGTNFGAWNLRLGGTYGINSVYTTRQIAFPGFMDRDTARFNAGTGQMFGELGFGTAIQSVAVEPFAGLAYVHLDTAGFTESGGASALSTSGASQDTGYSSLGLRAAAAYTLWNGMMLIPRASLAWQYAFGEINPATALAFAGIPGSNFNVTGVPIARNAALIDVGADLRINPQAKVGLYYWGQQASTAHENGLRGTLTWMF